MNININNYEEWMVDYLEGNLDRKQEQQLNHFLESHPELRAELELFEHTKVQPDMHVVFENKELLKKQETGRVIAMGNWKKYSIGIAAALLLFIGVRFINTNSPISGIKYEAKQITKPVFAFENKNAGLDSTETINKTEKVEKPEQYFAETKKKESKIEKIKNKSGNELKNESDQRDMLQMIENMEYAAVDQIYHKPLRGKMKDTNLPYSEDEYAMALGYHNKKDVETIIDKWNNTLAFAESVGGLLGFGGDENKRNITDDNYKETSIKVFDIEFYNRKTTNK